MPAGTMSPGARRSVSCCSAALVTGTGCADFVEALSLSLSKAGALEAKERSRSAALLLLPLLRGAVRKTRKAAMVGGQADDAIQQ